LTDFTFSGNGKYVAIAPSGNDPGPFSIHEIETGKLVDQFPRPKGVLHPKLSPDADVLLLPGRGKDIQAYDIARKDLSVLLEMPRSKSNSSELSSLAYWDSSGRKILTRTTCSDERMVVRKWDAESVSILAETNFPSDIAPFYSIAVGDFWVMPLRKSSSGRPDRYSLFDLNSFKVSFSIPGKSGGDLSFQGYDAGSSRVFYTFTPPLDLGNPKDYYTTLCVFNYPSGDMIAASRLPEGVYLCDMSKDGNLMLTKNLEGFSVAPVRSMVFPVLSVTGPARIWQIDVNPISPGKKE